MVLPLMTVAETIIEEEEEKVVLKEEKEKQNIKEEEEEEMEKEIAKEEVGAVIPLLGIFCSFIFEAGSNV